jgi:hypothetical protein
MNKSQFFNRHAFGQWLTKELGIVLIECLFVITCVMAFNTVNMWILIPEQSGYSGNSKDCGDMRAII